MAPLAAQEAPPHPDTVLERKILERIEGFRGTVGVHVRDLRSGAEVAVRADELFPAASTIKVLLLVTLHQPFEDGELDPGARLEYHDSLHWAGNRGFPRRVSSGNITSAARRPAAAWSTLP